jgi:hypothetical protein
VVELPDLVLVVDFAHSLRDARIALPQLDHYEGCGSGFGEPTEYVRRQEEIVLADGTACTCIAAPWTGSCGFGRAIFWGMGNSNWSYHNASSQPRHRVPCGSVAAMGKPSVA